MEKLLRFVILLFALFIAFADASAQKSEESVLVMEAVALVVPSNLVAALE